MAERKCPLDKDKWVPYKLIETIPMTHNTKIFRFELEEKQSLSLPIASCITTRANCGKDGMEIIRPYTPVSDNAVEGYFDLLIKLYPQGNMSRHIHNMQVGETLDIKGPFPKYQYKVNEKKHVGMIVGGTGITPMYQVLTHVKHHPEDETQITLLYANVSFDDIIFKDELDAMQANNKNFKVVYILEKPPQDWNGEVGFITPDLVKKHFPAPAADNLVFICGPPPMMNAISGDKLPDKSQGPVSGYMVKLGYDNSTLYKF